jgi:ABC-type antimicrobial peptide transport system permease subunit
VWLPDLGNSSNEVVGVVEDLKFASIDEQALHVFVPWTQRTTGGPFLLVKGTDDAPSIAPVVRRVIDSVEARTGIDRIAPLETLVSGATARQRFTARTVASFALLALTLAAIGVFGTLSYTVGARTREIAIRLSLGASRRVVVPDVLRGGFVPVLAGGLLGMAGAGALARTFETLLFQVEPLDMPSFVVGGLLLTMAAFAAALAPAIRVLRVDPVTALRAE